MKCFSSLRWLLFFLWQVSFSMFLVGSERTLERKKFWSNSVILR